MDLFATVRAHKRVRSCSKLDHCCAFAIVALISYSTFFSMSRRVNLNSIQAMSYHYCGRKRKKERERNRNSKSNIEESCLFCIYQRDLNCLQQVTRELDSRNLWLRRHRFMCPALPRRQPIEEPILKLRILANRIELFAGTFKLYALKKVHPRLESSHWLSWRKPSRKYIYIYIYIVCKLCGFELGSLRALRYCCCCCCHESWQWLLFERATLACEHICNAVCCFHLKHSLSSIQALH